MVGWLLAKQNQQNGALWTDVVDNVGEKDCRACCDCGFQIGISVCGKRDEEDNAFFRDDITDNDESKSMLSSLLPLRPVFLSLSFISS